MKLTTLLLFTSFMTISASIFSQSSEIRLNYKDAKVADILSEIENQSNYRFFYQNEQINVNRQTSVNIREKDILKILDHLFRGENVSYKIFDDNLILLLNKRITSEIPVDQNLAAVQPREVSGKVTDREGNPMIGVTVVEKGTTNGTITNVGGNYSLETKPGNVTLVFSSVGMKTLEFTVSNETTVDIVMEEDIIGLEEVVAIGYGTLKKSDLTGSISQIDPTRMEQKLTSNPTDILRNSIAGLYIPLSSDPKGSVNMSEVLIRGSNSLTASNSPLIVLDGMIYEGDLANISSADIERIDVMKDASSAAIYGSRSANGVILITTKKGKSGIPSINFRHTTGFATPSFLRPVQDPEGYIEMRQKLYSDYIGVRTKNPGYYSNPDNLPDGVSLKDWMKYSSSSGDPVEVWLRRLHFQDIEVKNYLAGKTVNWGDEVFQTGLREEDQISVSGGTENIKYYWSANYTDNEGFVVGEEYKSIRSRLNLESKIAKFLTIGLNSQFALKDESSIPVDWTAYYFASPYGSIYEEDGETLRYFVQDYSVARNPFINMTYNKRFLKYNDLNAKLYAIIDLPFGFTYQVNAINNFSFNRFFEHQSSESPSNSSMGYAGRFNSSSYSWTLDNILKWEKTFGKHAFDLTLMTNGEKYQYWSSEMTNILFFPTDYLGYHAMNIGKSPTVNSDDQVYTRSAMLARLNYNYQSKYYLTLAMRQDGYSAFGQDNPFAVFPTAAVAWKISEEKFFSFDPVNYLKLRFSWGANGNSAIGYYSALATMDSGKYLYSNYTTGAAYTTPLLRLMKMANSELQWEKTTAMNLGVDFGLFGNRVNGSLDGYRSITTDLLISRSLPTITGYSSVMSNLGRVDNQGIELMLNTVNIEKGQRFIWRSGFNLSFNKNKIVSLYGDFVDVLNDQNQVIGRKEVDDYNNRWFIGESIDAIWDYKSNGVWQEEEADLAYAYGGYHPGEFKMVDVNSDTLYTDLEDKQILGLSKAPFRWYLNNEFVFFKDFSLSFSLSGQMGFMGNFVESAGSDNFNAYVMPYWTPENRSNVNPRMGGDYEGAVRGTNYIRMDFIRLNDLSFGYNFPSSVSRKFHLNNLKIYTSINNVFVISKWPGWDPEFPGRPVPRYYNIGASIDL